jgi:GNAT superfamily N-acetyltransferase
MVADELDFVIGVDTHRDEHVLAVVTAPAGAVVARRAIGADRRGYREALRFAEQLAAGKRAWAIEGTGSYGGWSGPLFERAGRSRARDQPHTQDGAAAGRPGERPGRACFHKSRMTSRKRERAVGVVEVRAASPTDLEAIVAVNRAAATEAYSPIFGGLPYPEERVRARYQRLLGDCSTHLFVAEETGNPVGYTAARPGRLEALYVVPEWWGTGLADTLYERAAKIAGSEATLWVLRDNERGRRFWERRGWRATGEEDATSSAVECLYRLVG